MRIGRLAAALVILATAWPAVVHAAGRSRRPSAYQRLDPERLSEALRLLGMVELQEAFVKERIAIEGSTGSATLVSLLVDAKIARANQAGDAERDRLLDEAAALLKVAIAKMKDPDKLAAKMAKFKLQLKLADVSGRIRIERYASRLTYLMAGELDRRIIIERTKDTAKMLRRLRRSVSDTIEDTRENNTEWIMDGQDLLALQRLLKYRGAIINLNRAIALHDDIETERGERRTLLGRTITALADFVREGDPWASLATGRAYRELKRHDEVARILSKLLTPGVPVRARYDALFEIARNRIEQGKFDQGAQRIDVFRTEGMKLAADDGQKFGVDLHATMLRNYLHETWAKVTKGPEADRHRTEAERALLVLANNYPRRKYQDYLLAVVARKYRGRKDIHKLGSLVLFAKARGKMVEGQPDSSGRIKEAPLIEAAALLRTVVARIPGPASTRPAAASRPSAPIASSAGERQIAKELHPLVLWDLGVIHNWMRENRACAQSLLALARNYPDHKLAPRAALAAVKSYQGIIQKAVRQKKPVHNQLRRELVQALVVLLGRWGNTPEAREWQVDLGRQYRLLARRGVAASDEQRFDLLDKSVKAFGKVDPKSVDAMEAQFLALKGRTELLREAASKPGKIKTATELSKAMASYAAAVPAAIERITKAAARAADPTLRESLQDVAKLLPSWGAESAFEGIVIRDEFLGQREAALAALAKLAKDKTWRGTDILPMAKEYEIRILVESSQDRTDEAVAKVQKFLNEHPKHAEVVLAMVVKRIRKRIGELQDDPAKAAELKRSRDTYLNFARKLKKIADERGHKGDYLYTTDKTLADALTEAGKFDEALGLWKSCRARDEERRRVAAAPIRKDIAARIAAVKRAGAAALAIEACAVGYFKLLEEEGIDPNGSVVSIAVKRSLKALRDEDKHKLAARQEHAKQLAEDLIEALGSVQEILIGRISIDVANVHGLARAHAGLKQYAEAIKYYRQLVRAVDRAQYPGLYWRLELAYCRTAKAGYADKPKSMRRLKIYILQLRQQDSRMGGLGPLFDELLREVSRLAQ